MAIAASTVMELRKLTGSGLMDCKKALQETGGDLPKAVEALRKKGLASAGKKAGREAKEGLIYSYIHSGGKVGVLLEINCETDFVARTDDFQALAKDICMHIAASSPLCIRREDIPEETVEKEKEIYRAQLENSGKPANIINKIIQGKIEKCFYAQQCLQEQPFVKDTDKTVGQLITEHIARLGENISLNRFTLYKLGG
ncbi:MAG: translation elongation factor Ts [bacterium]